MNCVVLNLLMGFCRCLCLGCDMALHRLYDIGFDICFLRARCRFLSVTVVGQTNYPLRGFLATTRHHGHL